MASEKQPARISNKTVLKTLLLPSRDFWSASAEASDAASNRIIAGSSADLRQSSRPSLRFTFPTGPRSDYEL